MVVVVVGVIVVVVKKGKCEKEFSNRVIFIFFEGSWVLYFCVVELSDGMIFVIVSWRDLNVVLVYFFIYESKDYGWSWMYISNVMDDVGIGL